MRKALTAGLATVLGTGIALSATNAAVASPRVALRNGKVAWANAANSRGSADTNAVLSLRVYLKLRNADGATAFAQAVNDPKSPKYHQYLSSAQFHAAYSPTASDVAQVSAWLTSNGFRTGYVPGNNLYVSASGSVGASESAFGVHLRRYSVRGLTLRAADAAPTVPTSVSGLINGVVGLDESARLVRPGGITDRATTNAPPSPGFRNARPCSASWGSSLADTLPRVAGITGAVPWVPCGYKPAQLRAAYGVDQLVAKGLDGRGVTVGIVDAFASPTIKADIVTYAQRNDPTHPWAANQYREMFPPGLLDVSSENPCDPQGWYGEETLDVEAVHAIAPGAKVIYSGGKSCEDPAIDAALVHLIDGNQVNLISNSYGNLGETAIPADERAIFDAIATQAAAQGIGLYFSSGDSGDEFAMGAGNLTQPEVDFSANSPLVTAVGGTSTGIDAHGKVVVEKGWETGLVQLGDPATSWDTANVSYLYGAGGGTSRVYEEPSYQRGVVPDALAKRFGARGRVVPDISMDGDPNTGMLIGQTQTFAEGVSYDEFRIGGTSLSSPLFAGMMALVDQNAGHRHGLVNIALYSLSAKAFRDVVPGAQAADVRRNFANSQNPNDGYGNPSLRLFDDTSSQIIHTAVGYDDVTGRGVPNGWDFIRALAR